MLLKEYQAYTHGIRPNAHVDITLTFEDHPKIKLCDCTAYLGGANTYDDLTTIVASARADLDKLCGTVDVEVKRDIIDDSIDILRFSDGALLFSVECDKLEGAEWVPVYNSAEG